MYSLSMFCNSTICIMTTDQKMWLVSFPTCTVRHLGNVYTITTVQLASQCLCTLYIFSNQFLCSVELFCIVVLCLRLGPHTWAVNFPDAAGHDQSPIDIHTNETVYDSELESKPLVINYCEEDSFTACNTGSSFKVNISKTSGR